MRDFLRTHPSGSGKVPKIPPSVAKIKPSITNEGTSAKPGVPNVTEEESTESEDESWGRDKDDNNNDHNSSSEGSDQESDSGADNTQSDNEKGSDSEHEIDENETGSESDQQENEEEVEDDEEEKEEKFVEDNAEGDEDKGIDYTTNQFDDDVDVRLNDPVHADEGYVQKEGTDAEMINVQQGNENMEITSDQVIEDAHVTISIITKKTKVPVTSSSHLFDLASKFLNFADIPHADAKLISPMDVHVHHEVTSNQTPILLTVPITVITESSHVYTIAIPESLPSFTPPPPLSTPTPPPTTKATNPLSILPDFASVFQFNNRVSALEKEVSELRKDDLLNTQVTALVDEHLDSRLGATRDEFMSYLSASITARITEQVKIQLPQILPKEVSNFAPLSTYEAVASLTEFELKKILIDKMDKSQSYLTATPYRECYDGLLKSYNLDKSLFSTYDKVYPLKRSQEDKDKDEDPSAGSDRGLKKRKTSKDDEPTKGPKTKESKSSSSKDSDMPHNQEGNLGNDDEETMREVTSKHDWFTKPKQPQEPTDPDWNVRKTPQQRPTQSWLMTLAATDDKPSKTFDELISTPIDFFAYIMNDLNITNLTKETLLGPAFKLFKGTHTNFAELEYDFEECYKAL
ncbi:hypothetical protein Tco_1189480 [Tanacetum coccineum]